MSMETEKMETPEDVREIVYKAAVALRLGAYGMGGEPDASDLSAAEDILKAVWDDVVDWEHRRLLAVAQHQYDIDTSGEPDTAGALAFMHAVTGGGK